MKPLLPLTLLALLLTVAAWGAIIRAPRIYVNGLPAFAKATAGKPLRSARGGPAAVIVKDGVTYVPLRAVAEALGCTVDGARPERSRGDPKSARIFIWGGQTAPRDPNAALRNPQSEPGPGLPAPGLPPDPRPVLPQAPGSGRP